MKIYKPREDSKLLLDYLNKISCSNKTILEIGTGSGIIAETAKSKGAKVIATDLNPDACLSAKYKNIKTICSDLLKGINPKKKFDIIIFNPPYLPESPNSNENFPDLVGGKKGYELTLEFIKQAKPHLTNHGFILFIASSLSKPKELLEKIKKLKLKSLILETLNFDFESIFLIKVW